MQIKEVKPMTFFYHSLQTSLEGLTPQIGSVAKELYKEAVQNDLAVTGPVYWQYLGFVPKPDASFTLHIALPVAEAKPDYHGKFAFQQTSPFKCLTTIHEGNWTDIPQTYQKLFGYIAQHGLQPTGLDREVYLNVSFTDPEANVTEVQIGIQ